MFSFRRLYLSTLMMADAGDTGGAPAAAPAASTPAAAPAATPAAAPTPADAPAAATPDIGNLVADAGKTADDAAAAEAKTAEEQKAADDAKAAEAAKAAITPDSYDFKFPDGFNVDTEKLTAVKGILAESKVPPEQAQKLIDTYATEVAKASQAPYDMWRETQTKWQNEVRNDPEIGGAALAENLANLQTGALRVLGAEGRKAFNEALNFTGAGNNPAIVKGLIKAFAGYAEGSTVQGGPGGSGQRTAGETLYGTAGSPKLGNQT